MGTVRTMANLAAIPPLGELDPQRCYISWDIALTTSAGREAIRDVFIFVEDACEMTIEAAAEQVAEQAPEKVSKRSSTAPNAAQEKRQSMGRRAYDIPDAASSIRVTETSSKQLVEAVV